MREGSILFVICSSFLNIQVFYCYTILTRYTYIDSFNYMDNLEITCVKEVFFL